MGHDIRDVRRDNGGDAVGNVLVAHDFVRMITVGYRILRVGSRAMSQPLPPSCPAAAANDLPIAHVRGAAQQRIEMPQEGRERKAEAAAANNFFAEKLDSPIFGVKTVSEVFGFGLEQLVESIDPRAQCAANSVGDRFRVARPFGVECCARLQASPMARAGGQFRVFVRRGDVFQDEGDEIRQLFAFQFQMDVSLDNAAKQLLQGEI